MWIPLRSSLVKLLRSSEKYVRTDMAYVVQGGFWINLPQVVSAITSLLVAYTFANFASQETYGFYRYLLSFAGIIGAFSLTGMNTAVTRAVAQGKDGAFLGSIPVQMKWSILTLLSALAIAGYYLIEGNYTLSAGILLIGLFQPITNITNTYSAYLSGRKDFRTLSTYGIATNILSTVAILLAVLLSKNALVIFAVFLASAALWNAVFYFRTKRLADKSLPADPEAVGYGRKLSVLNALSAISSQLDSILVFHFLGARDLAVYAFAVIVPDKIRSLFRFTSVLALPKLAEKNPREISESIVPKVVRFFILSAVLVLIYIAAAPLVYGIFFGQYEVSVSYSQIYALSLLTMAGYMPVTALLSLGPSQKLYWFSALSPAVQIIATSFLVYFFGIWGAVWSRIISHAFNFFFSSYLTMKKS